MGEWTYTLVAAGDRYALPQNIEANQIDSYLEHSLSVNRSFALKKCMFKVQGDILNLTDKTYDIFSIIRCRGVHGDLVKYYILIR